MRRLLGVFEQVTPSRRPRSGRHDGKLARAPHPRAWSLPVGPKHVLVIVGFKWFPGDGGPFGALGPCSGKGVGGVKKS